jgi:hypothetical protein
MERGGSPLIASSKGKKYGEQHDFYRAEFKERLKRYSIKSILAGM